MTTATPNYTQDRGTKYLDTGAEFTVSPPQYSVSLAMQWSGVNPHKAALD